MRRVFGITLTGLGAFLIVLAAMCRFYLPGQVIKFPLNEYNVSTLTGTNASYFSQQTLAEVKGASIRAISTVQGDVAAGSSSTAVWNNVTGVFDVTSSPKVPISYATQRLAFDRRTGVLVNCCGAQVGTARPRFAGQGYVWPIGTQPTTYDVFNTTLMKSVPAKYAGTSTVDGLSVDIFVQPVNHQQISTVTVPGSLIGIPDQTTVKLPEFLTATNTFYVDPETGSPVKVIEAQNETLQDPSTGAIDLVLLDGTLTTTPQTVATAVSTAKHYDTEISIVQKIIPVAGGLVGLALLVCGIALLFAYTREYYEYEEDEEELAAQA